jgi:hypothetical protein
MNIRLIDEVRKPHDIDVIALPSKGDIISSDYAINNGPVEHHWFQVQEVIHMLDSDSIKDIAVLVKEIRVHSTITYLIFG